MSLLSFPDIKGIFNWFGRRISILQNQNFSGNQTISTGIFELESPTYKGLIRANDGRFSVEAEYLDAFDNIQEVREIDINASNINAPSEYKFVFSTVVDDIPYDKVRFNVTNGSGQSRTIEIFTLGEISTQEIATNVNDINEKIEAQGSDLKNISANSETQLAGINTLSNKPIIGEILEDTGGETTGLQAVLGWRLFWVIYRGLGGLSDDITTHCQIDRDGNAVVVGGTTTTNGIVKINRAGGIVWSHPAKIRGLNSDFFAKCFIQPFTEEVFYGNENGDLMKFSKDGEVLWDVRPVESHVAGIVSRATNRLYVGYRNGDIHQININTGADLGKVYEGESIRDMVYGEQSEFYAADNDKIIQLNESNGNLNHVVYEHTGQINCIDYKRFNIFFGTEAAQVGRISGTSAGQTPVFVTDTNLRIRVYSITSDSARNVVVGDEDGFNKYSSSGQFLWEFANIKLNHGTSSFTRSTMCRFDVDDNLIVGRRARQVQKISGELAIKGFRKA